MYKDQDYINMTAEQFIIYIRKTHQKYAGALPEKLEKWTKSYISKDKAAPIPFHREHVMSPHIKSEPEDSIPIGRGIWGESDSPQEVSMDEKRFSPWKIPPAEDRRRFELLLKVVESNKLVGANTETVADYAIELTNALLKKFDE